VSDREFDDLVDVEGLDAEEVARLRRVHDLLLEAGPPADLPPALERPPAETKDDAEILQFPLLPRRRLVAAVVVAAALVAAAFGAGFLVGDHRGGSGSTFEIVRVIPLRGTNGGNGALASIQMGKRDEVGNWPMHFSVSGLPKQKEGGYYNLYLVKDGRPVVLCGSFRVKDRTTTVTFTVPYKETRFEGWVVTQQAPGHHTPGPVVLST
jgi:hypothetical protein